MGTGGFPAVLIEQASEARTAFVGRLFERIDRVALLLTPDADEHDIMVYPAVRALADVLQTERNKRGTRAKPITTKEVNVLGVRILRLAQADPSEQVPEVVRYTVRRTLIEELIGHGVEGMYTRAVEDRFANDPVWLGMRPLLHNSD